MTVQEILDLTGINDQSDSMDAEYLRLLDEADKARRCSDLPKVFKLLNEAIRLKPFHYEAWYKKSLSYWVQSKYIDALRVLRFVLLHCQLTPYWRYIVDGFIHELCSQLDVAQNCYMEAGNCVDSESSGMEAHFNLGFIYLQRQEFQNAADSFTRALKVQEDFYEQQKIIYANAPRHFKWVYLSNRHKPLVATCHNNIGIAYENLYDDQSALKHTTIAIRVWDKDYYFFKNRVKCNLKLHRHEEAIKDCNVALALLRSRSVEKQILAELYCLRGNAYFDMGEPDAAMKDFKYANELCPQFYYPYILLAATTMDVRRTITYLQRGLECCLEVENLYPLASFLETIGSDLTKKEREKLDILLKGLEKSVLVRID